MNLEEERDQLRNNLIASNEMLALVLATTGPVTIDRKKHVSVPAGAQIKVDIDSEAESVVVSLDVPSEQ